MRAVAVLKERGSALIEMVFAFLFVMMLALGIVQIAFSLYARNVVMSSAHEAARAAVERGRTGADARAVASRVLRQGAGRIFEGARVQVVRRAEGNRLVVAVSVTGTIRSLGPFPVSLPMNARATATGNVPVP